MLNVTGTRCARRRKNPGIDPDARRDGSYPDARRNGGDRGAHRDGLHADAAEPLTTVPGGASDVRTNVVHPERTRMGIMSKILGGGDGRSAEDYVELDPEEDIEAAASGAEMAVHVAEIGDQQDVIAVKDAVYDGDFVIAELTRHSTTDRTSEHIIDELRQVADEVDGDIVQRGEDQLIVAPTGVRIAREKLV